MKNALDLVKPKIDVKRLMMAVALTAFIVGHAEAAQPKGGEIAGDVVTLGDVFDGVTENADYVLAPAPAPGKSLTLNARDLKRVSDAFSLGWQPSNMMEQVVLRKAAQDVANDIVKAALQEKFAQEAQGRKFDLQIPANLRLHLPQNVPATVEVESLNYDAARGTFTAVLAAPSVADPQVRREMSGRAFALAEVPVLKSALQSGDVISANDIVYSSLRAADLPAGTIMDAEKLAGLSPRRGITAGKPLQANDLEMPTMVKKGEAVTLVLKNSRLNLALQGKAMQSGAEGEIVRVLNTSSNRVVEGTVTGPQTVSIKAPSSVLAQN